MHDALSPARSKVQLLARASALVEALSTIHQRPLSASLGAALPAEHELVDFPSEVVPLYEAASFVVQGWSELRRRADPVFSLPLHSNGLQWRLKVYPVRGIVFAICYLLYCSDSNL